MKCYTRLMKVSRIDRVINKETLSSVNEKKTTWKPPQKKIINRRERMIGHFLRNGDLYS